MNKEPITITGLEKLKEELVFLKEKKRPEIVAAIAEARSHGDLKENAEYHAAKEQQSHNEGRIQEVEDLIARANVIDVTKISNDGKVIFGSSVYLVNLDTDEKIDFGPLNNKAHYEKVLGYINGAGPNEELPRITKTQNVVEVKIGRERVVLDIDNPTEKDSFYKS